MELPWDYYTHILIIIALYSILAQAFNLNFGLAGQFNLAHIAAYAVGAYTTALLSTDFETGFFTNIIASSLLSGTFALLIGGISIKLSHDYFAIGTLAFSSIISALLINWRSLTHGVLGITNIPRPVIAGYEFTENVDFLILITSFALLAQILLYFLFRSCYSRSLKAQAEYEPAALALGINTFKVRQISFFISAFFAGLAGSFFAYYINYIDPSSFAIHEMIFVLTIIIIGRPSSFWGCLGSCAFLVILPEVLRYLELPPSVLGQLRQLTYAVILYMFVYLNRSRLFPVARNV
jgi:branched-chain amino acid transport system permease protein